MKEEDPDLSVVIVTWNCGEKVFPTLELLGECKEISVEILVVDNGSADGTPDLIREKFPSVICLPQSDNLGFAKAVNIGAAASKGRMILLLNDDAKLSPDSCKKLLSDANETNGLGVMGAQLVFPDGRPQNSVAAVPNLSTELLNKSLLKALFPKAYPSRHQNYSEVTDVPSVIGACFLTPRKVFEKLGGLNEAFFFYLEETDYCVRSREEGFRVVHNPNVRVDHELGRSSKRVAVWSKVQYHRSLLTFFDLHRGGAIRRFLRCSLFVQHLWKLALTAFALVLTCGLQGRLRLKAATYVALLKWNIFEGHRVG